MDNWVTDNLSNALTLWNDTLTEIWALLTQSPQSFHGGAIWPVISGIHSALMGIGYGLLVVFFAMGLMKSCGSFAELRRPEMALRLFVRFAITKGVITWGMDLMMAILEIVQGAISAILGSLGGTGGAVTALPQEIINAVDACTLLESIPLWAITLIGSLAVWALSFVLILSVYGRFFRLYMYTAIAALPLSTLAGEPSQSVGLSFLRSYAAVCLEGAIVALACVIFSAFASTPPAVQAGAPAATMVWQYLGEVIFNALVLVGCVKMADRVVREMMGL